MADCGSDLGECCRELRLHRPSARPMRQSPQNIENNPMHSSLQSPSAVAGLRDPAKTFARRAKERGSKMPDLSDRHCEPTAPR
jgi:hypothetical protein